MPGTVPSTGAGDEVGAAIPSPVRERNEINAMHVFGRITQAIRGAISDIVASSTKMSVERKGRARSSRPLPNSTDLERALIPLLRERRFVHHVRMTHPRTGDGFEYDFWRADDQVAMEIMGYRADDEVYKNILKFHVHTETKVGVVWVPRWKWISGKRTDTNFRATMKALAFAQDYMDVEALVALAYDWTAGADDGRWCLEHCENE